MANRYWIGTTSTDWSDTNNWSALSGGAGAAGVPTNADAAIFDTNSNANDCVLTAASVCLSLTSDVNHTANFDMNGQTLTVSGAFNYDGTGVLTIDAALTLDADGNFHLGSTIGTLNWSGNLDLQGTGNFDIDKAAAATSGNITCAYNGKTVTVTGAVALEMNDSVLTLATGGTLILTYYIIINCITESNPFLPNGATIGGVAGLYINALAAITINIPATTIAARFLLQSKQTSVAGAAVFNITGAISSSNWLGATKSDTGQLTINTNNNAITTTDIFRFDNSSATNALIVNFGSSVVSINNLLQITANRTIQFNMSSSTWSVTGNWGTKVGFVMNGGTSVVTFNGNGAQDITSNGGAFYDVIINKGGGTMQLQDAMSVDTLVLTDGSFDMNGVTLASVGDILLDGNDTLTLDAAITMTGDGNFHIGATPAVVTAAACNLDLQGTGNLDIDQAVTFNNVTCAYNTKTTTISGTGLTIGGNLTLNNAGGTLVINQNFIIQGNWNNAASATITAGASQISFTGNNAQTITSGAELFFNILINKGASGVTLVDALSCNILDVNDGDFDQNGQNITTVTDATFDGDNLTLDGAFTMTGAGEFRELSIGVVNTAALVLTLQGATALNGSITMARLILTLNITYTFNDGDTFGITGYVAGDWDGAAGNLIVLVSATPGNAWLLNVVGGAAVNYVNVTDSNAAGGGVMTDTNGVNGGANINWVFPAPPVPAPTVGTRQRQYWQRMQSHRSGI